MDPKKFKQQLEEFAELEVIKVRNHTGRTQDEPIVVRRDNKDLAIDADNNQTLTYKVKKIKNQINKCPDCNKSVKNRTVTIKLLTFPMKHWRYSCNNCNLTQDPQTGKYTLKGIKAQNVWHSYLRSKMAENDIIVEEESISEVVLKKPTK